MKKMDELQADIVLDIFRASNLLERVGRKLAAQTGLASVQQWLLLGTISLEGELPLKDLRQNTLVTKQNITGMVERLKQGGYITTYVKMVTQRQLGTSELQLSSLGLGCMGMSENRNTVNVQLTMDDLKRIDEIFLPGIASGNPEHAMRSVNL